MLDEWQATTLEEGESVSKTVSLPGRPVSVAGADGVRYTTSFTDPRDPSDDVAVLDLRGLFAHSEVEVSGTRLDGVGTVEHDTYFRPLRIPFRPADQNEVSITCHAPRDRFGGIHDTDMVPDSLSVPGVWWDVGLESHPLPFIDSIDVRPELTADGATLELRTTVVTDEAIDDRITYSLRPAGDHQSRGMMERAAVKTDGPGKTVLEHSIAVHDPALWWPREFGQQNRYELRAKLGNVEHSVLTGICEVSFQDGALSVNGESVPIRGVNLLTDDEADISRVLEINANLVRAHAHVLPPRFYDRCDEQGILVWQDLPLTGPGVFDVERASELARSLSQAYSRHPSLAAYGIHDDPVQAFDDGLGTGSIDRLRLRWRAWRSSYDDEAERNVAASIPDDRPIFPVIGGPGLDSTAVSYYPGWDHGNAEDITILLERYPAEIVAEFGAGALSDREIDSEDIAGFDQRKHDRHVEDGTEASQQYQSKVLRTVVETVRAAGLGAIPFALRDTDVAGMGVYAQDGTKKAAVDLLETAFEPVQAFCVDPSPGTTAVVVLNDRPTGLTATVEWEAGDAHGSLDVTVGAQGRWNGGSIEVPDTADWLTLQVSGETVDVSNTYKL